jgi:hypothetical protein
MVAWQGRIRHTPGQFGPGEGCLDEPGPETRGAHQGQRVGDGGHGLTEPEPEPKRAMVCGSSGYVQSDGRLLLLGQQLLQGWRCGGCDGGMAE